MISAPASSPKGAVQPPYWKAFEVSSSGPPGACITPSRVIMVLTIIFLIVLCFITSKCQPPLPRCCGANATITGAEYEKKEECLFVHLFAFGRNFILGPSYG